jgi:hypothetical protein
MAEHRRVEARTVIAGTGMASDVDRLRDIEADTQRKQRMWRDAPDKDFGEVLSDAPVKGELEEQEPVDQRKRRQRDPREAALSAASSAALVGAAVVEGARADKGAPDLPRVPPDPRERVLRAQLARDVKRPTGPAPVDLPPKTR